MLRLSGYLSLIMFVFSIAMNLDLDGKAAKKEASADSEEQAEHLSFAYKATLSNRDLHDNRSWFHVLMVAIITFITIKMIRQTRTLAQKAY